MYESPQHTYVLDVVISADLSLTLSKKKQSDAAQLKTAAIMYVLKPPQGSLTAPRINLCNDTTVKPTNSEYFHIKALH